MNLLTKSCALALAGSLFATTAAAGQLSVETNKTIPVRIKGAAASIVLGNKNVADTPARTAESGLTILPRPSSWGGISPCRCGSPTST